MIPVLCALAAVPLAAQRPGVEVQAYPAGLITAARLAVPLGSRFALEVGAGANFTDRRDWGVHEEERGWGPGGSAGLRWAPRPRGPWLGVRAGLWRLAVDWRDPSVASGGTTRVLVWQPTFRAGWRWYAGGLALDLALAFGREVNVRTRGAAVGAGWIGLAGAGVSWWPP